MTEADPAKSPNAPQPGRRENHAPSRGGRLRPVGWLAVAIALVAVPAAPAQTTATWQGDNPGHPSDWGKNNNWTPSGIPTGTQIAQFINVAVNTNANFNRTGLVIGQVSFTSNALAYTLSSSSGNTLTINGVGGVGISDAAANTQTISGGIVLGGSQTWSITNSSGLVAVSGVISGTGMALTKSGAGTLRLSGANTYSGATTISAGTLTLTGSGSIASSPTVTVASGATLNVTGVTGGSNFANGSFSLAAAQTLAGSGTVSGTMNVASTAVVSPGTGTSRATLTVGATTLQAGSFFDIDIGSFANLTDVDLLNVVGALTANNVTVRVRNQAGAEPSDQLTRTYTIATTTGGVTLSGTPTISPSGFASGANFSLSTANGGRDLVLSYVPVPEPAAVLAVFAVGLGLVHVGRRLRRPQAQQLQRSAP